MGIYSHNYMKEQIHELHLLNKYEFFHKLTALNTNIENCT